MTAAAWPFPESHHDHDPRSTTRMAFELDTPTNSKIVDVTVLAEKDREPGTDPGVGVDLAITTSNDLLAHFDGFLRGMLYTKNPSSSTPAQASLEGVPPVSDMPNLTEIGKRLGQFKWDTELTGYSMVIDRGLGGKSSNLELEDCKLSNFSVFPKEGGSVVIKFRVESPNISEKLHGQLAVLKTSERPITLIAPEVQQSDVEGAGS